MPEIEASEKRQGLHLAGFRSAAVESKEDFLAGKPKMPAKCESQARAVRRSPRRKARVSLFRGRLGASMGKCSIAEEIASLTGAVLSKIEHLRRVSKL